MRVLVTGSAGHLGEALVRTLRDANHDVIGLDIVASPFTTHVGSVTDRAHVKRCVGGVEAVLHTATLHKPHVATHTRQAFVDTNDFGPAFVRVQRDMAAYYLLGYASTNSTLDGKYRKISVKLKDTSQGYKLEARNGYYAPADFAHLKKEG